MTLRLYNDMNEQLSDASPAEDRCIEQVEATAISECLARKQATQIQALFSRIAERDASLLERLAQS